MGSIADKTRTGAPKRLGRISREEIYNAAMLNKLGIGQVKLAEARKSGVVSPFKVGTDYWYEGTEIIEWIKTHERVKNGVAKRVGVAGGKASPVNGV